MGGSSTIGDPPLYYVILLYGKSPTMIWNPSYQPYDPKYLETHYRRRDAEGRRYRTDNVTAGGLTGGGYE